MNLIALLAVIQSALATAPKAIEIVKELKDFVAALFTKRLISKAEQDALHAYVDAAAAMVAAGIVPDHWRVEPDPVGLPIVNMPIDPSKDVFSPQP